jgi:heme-degrading monooxygenase HmoA
VVRTTLQMKVKPGREADFERAWREIAERVRQAPGNVRQTLTRDPQDPCSFVITSDWESRELFHQFERSPEQDALTAPLREMRESARMSVHDVVVHLEGRA